MRILALATTLAVPRHPLHKPLSITARAAASTPITVDAAAFSAARRAAVASPFASKLSIGTFLHRSGLLAATTTTAAAASASRTPLVLDVRAPCEFAQGHIPGAVNVPLFDDAERAEIGTLYKQRGHDVAVARGLALVEQKGADWLLAPVARELCEGDEVLVYCARGGMRSGGMAHLLAQAPLRVSTLDGGYKRFRRWALESFDEMPRPVAILSGKTGSGKTDVLLAMRDGEGCQVLDLEGEAHHRGSIFGSLGRAAQPSAEHFENRLAVRWAGCDPARTVFIEDESHNVGRCGVPRGLWRRMRAERAAVLRLAVPHEARLSKLVQEYGGFGAEALGACVAGLAKKLGGARVARLQGLLELRSEAGLREVADELLRHYYDPMYEHQMRAREAAREPVHVVCDGGDAAENARRVLDAAAALGLRR